MSPRPRNRLVLVAILLAFVAPLLIATWLQRSGWLPDGRKNYGELLAPPEPLPAARLQAGGEFAWKTREWDWSLLVRLPNDCAQACRQALLELPRLRQSLGRHATKLRIVVLDAPGRNAGQLLTGRGIYPIELVEAGTIESILPEPRTGLRLGLVDPNGFLVLRFPENAEAARLRRDLERLLR